MDDPSAETICLDAAQGGTSPYPEWALIKPLLPQHSKLGRPWTHELRTVLDAILHLLRTGCAWSALPHWAPPRSTIYDWFRRLADGGWLERMHHVLLMLVREHQGREASPTLGIVDSQTVKAMAPAGPRGFDAAKKINGRKRHILADSQGNMLAVHVTDGACRIAMAVSLWSAKSVRSSPGLSV